MSFSVTFDQQAASSQDFVNAFNTAVAFYERMFSDPITINLQVSLGEVCGRPLSAGFISQTVAPGPPPLRYSDVRDALARDAQSTDDATALGTLGAADPTGGRDIVLSSAEAKALGLMPGDAAGVDGFVGFSADAPWSFDPLQRDVPGAWDFIGIAEHEISEVLGRFGYGQTADAGADGVIDLFRYSAPGVRDLSPGFNGTANYFSIDGGVTAVNWFNARCCGDLSDWVGSTADSFNVSPLAGLENGVSEGDLKLLDVLGYDRTGDDPPVVPEPGTAVLVGAGLALLVAGQRRVFSRAAMRLRSLTNAVIAPRATYNRHAIEPLGVESP